VEEFLNFSLVWKNFAKFCPIDIIDKLYIPWT